MNISSLELRKKSRMGKIYVFNLWFRLVTTRSIWERSQRRMMSRITDEWSFHSVFTGTCEQGRATVGRFWLPRTLLKYRTISKLWQRRRISLLGRNREIEWVTPWFWRLASTVELYVVWQSEVTQPKSQPENEGEKVTQVSCLENWWIPPIDHLIKDLRLFCSPDECSTSSSWHLWTEIDLGVDDSTL